MSASIPAVIHPTSNDVATCPVCDNEVGFIAPNADLSRRFDDMTEAAKDAHNDHCVENHPNEPVWNTFPKRSNVRILSVEGFIQYTLELAAETMEWNPIRNPSWEHTTSHLYRRLAVARSLTDDPSNVLVRVPDYVCAQLTLDWKNWIKASTKTFLTSLMDNVWTSDEPEGWETPSLQRLENLIQIFFRQDRGYATCGLIANTLIPTVPQWPNDVNWDEVALSRKKGRKQIEGCRILRKRQKDSKKAKASNDVGIQLIEPREANDDIEESDNSSVDANKPPLGVGDVIMCQPGIRAALSGATAKAAVVVSASGTRSRCVIGVHPYGTFGAYEYIQRRSIVDRKNGMQDTSKYDSLHLIHLPDSEPWRAVNEFHLIEGREEHPDSLANNVATVMERFNTGIHAAFRASMSNQQT
jgi:hypothetical protein